MSDHARLSLSHSDLWMGCAAWPRIVADVGEETSPEIEFGNDSHAILENMLIDAHVSNPALKDECDCAKETYDYVMAQWEQMGFDETTCLAEADIKVTSTGRDDVWGSADVVLYNEHTLHVIDHKTGVGTYVDEKTSNQLKHYAVGAIDTFSLKPERILMTISQPRFWGDEPKQRTLEMTRDELMVWLATESVPAAKATDDPNAVGTASTRCKKCAGRHVCEYRDQAVCNALTGVMATTMEVQEVEIRKNQDETIYDNDRLSEVLMMVPVIRDYCDALEEHAQEIIMKGEKVPSYKVVATGGRAKWTDEEAVAQALHKTQTAKKAFTPKLKTPNQIMALKPSAGLKKKLEALIGHSDGGLALVLESDERESVAPSFEVVQQELLPASLVPQNPIDTTSVETTQPPAELPAFLL